MAAEIKPAATTASAKAADLGPLPPLAPTPGSTIAKETQPVVAAKAASVEKPLAAATASVSATAAAATNGTSTISPAAPVLPSGADAVTNGSGPALPRSVFATSQTQQVGTPQGETANQGPANLKITGKDFADALKQAGKDYVAGGKDAGKTLKTMASLPFMKGQPVSLTLDQIVSAVFFLVLAFQVLLMQLFRPSLIWFVIFLALGMVFGLGLSFLYYKNKRDKAIANQVLAINLGQKGVQHLLGFLPTWFQLSEREKMEWLNEIIEELWPYVDKAASNMIKEITKRETSKVLKDNKALGAAVKEIGFKHLTFGGAPFRVEGIWVKDDSPNALVMEVDVRYAGDPNITLAITVPTGKLCPRVTDIVFVGSMRITLTPLVDRIPGFVAATATFRKQPLIKYRLDFGKALGGSYVAAPVMPVVNYFVKDVLTKMMVWPQRLVVPILQQTAEDKLVVQRLQLRSQGVLRVKVVKAKDLPNKDTFGKNDVFAEMTTDNEYEVTTTTKRGAGAEPVWNEEFFLLVQEPTSQEMRITLKDRDLINPMKLLSGQVTNVVGSSSLIGRALVKLKNVTKEEPTPIEFWEPLGAGDWGNPGGPGKGCGKVLLRCTYRSFANFQKSEVEDSTKGIVLVRLVQLKNVARAPDSSSITVSVSVKLDRGGDKCELPGRVWSLAAEQRKMEWASKPIATELYLFAESKEMNAEPELVNYALSKLPKDLKGNMSNLNVDIFRKLVDAKDIVGKVERASPWRDRLADLVDADPKMRVLFKEYEKNRLRIEKGWFDVDLDYSNDNKATAVFYNVSLTDEIKLKIMEKNLTSANDKLGRLDVGVSEIMSANDVNVFTGAREWGYMHKKLVEMEESEDQNGKKALIEVIYRWVPYLSEPEESASGHHHHHLHHSHK